MGTLKYSAEDSSNFLKACSVHYTTVVFFLLSALICGISEFCFTSDRSTNK